jgi:hypothetical protein
VQRSSSFARRQVNQLRHYVQSSSDMPDKKQAPAGTVSARSRPRYLQARFFFTSAAFTVPRCPFLEPTISPRNNPISGVSGALNDETLRSPLLVRVLLWAPVPRDAVIAGFFAKGSGIFRPRSISIVDVSIHVPSCVPPISSSKK